MPESEPIDYDISAEEVEALSKAAIKAKGTAYCKHHHLHGYILPVARSRLSALVLKIVHVKHRVRISRFRFFYVKPFAAGSFAFSAFRLTY
jgi:hypothetical protein